MERGEILKSLEQIDGSIRYIFIFDNVYNHAADRYITKDQRHVSLLRLKDKLSKQKPEANGRYTVTLPRPHKWDEDNNIKMQRSRYTLHKHTFDLLLSYIDYLIKQLQPRSNKKGLTFREALILDNADEFIKAVKPFLKKAKNYVFLYYALRDMQRIEELNKKEAHTIMTAEFGDIGAYKYFSKELKDLIDLKRQGKKIDEEDRMKIRNFQFIIAQYLPKDR